MKLSRLYANLGSLFTPIDFLPGINIIEAEIRLPENLDKDTHNLGKSTVGVLLDFVLLARRDPDIFLYKRPDLFGEFVFYVELEIRPGAYLTVRRSVADPTRIWLKRHSTAGNDYSGLVESDWSHTDISFDKARDLVDAALDLRDIDPWKFRNVIGYFLRSQDDYQDVFKLQHSIRALDWKPVLARMLGLDGERVVSHFEAAARTEELRDERDRLKVEIQADKLDPLAIDGRLQLIDAEIKSQQDELNALDFDSDDRRVTKDLVDTLNEEISDRNRERYYLTQSRSRLERAIADSVPDFRVEEAAILFEEAGVLFPAQLVEDFDSLLAFNRAVTRERRRYLKIELGTTEDRLLLLDAELKTLNTQRSRSLTTIAQRDVFRRYRESSDSLVKLMSDREQLARKKESLTKLQLATRALQHSDLEREVVAQEVEANIVANRSDAESVFGRVVATFSAIVLEVIDHRAVLTAGVNSVGNIEFDIDIFDEYEKPSSAGAGNTYRKVLCAAFDLALIQAHLEGHFPKFVYHDGLFESLDDRKKRKLMAAARTYADIGIQQVITVIDSDLPNRSRDGLYSDDEVVLMLHDEGPEGRLFHLPEW